jgi:RNA recognition motif-containing protein
MRPAPFKGNIIVTNFPDDFTGASLAALFDDYGLVLGAVIERPQGASARAPRGMVSLAPPKAVEAAIESLDGQVIGSRHLKVRKAPEKPKRPAGTRAASRTAPRPAKPLPESAPEAMPFFAARPPATVRRAPVVERRSLSGDGFRRIRFFDESKNKSGQE